MTTLHYDDCSQLSLALIEAQYRLLTAEKSAKSVLILISGIETAGKGKAVKQLREWIDPRYLSVKSHEPQLIQTHQPVWLRYTPDFPATGQITVMFGAWYTDLFATALHTTHPLNQYDFQHYVHKIQQFEQDLMQNNVHLIKVWFDLPWKKLQKRLKKIDPSERHLQALYGINWQNKAQYQALQNLRQYLSQDWLVIDGQNPQRNQYFAEYVLKALQDTQTPRPKVESCYKAQTIPEVLHHPQAKSAHSTEQIQHYKKQIKQLSQQVAQLLRQRRVIIVLEGMDAAGKGGAIKRIIKKLDPREYDIHTIAAPAKYELSRPYLWRFWTKLATGRKIHIFDRSWYGRVLVERIEHFASECEWQRAYAEINRFEQDLYQHQIVVVKLWLAISNQEQLYRFEQREQTPHKQFKITSEDWRNRAKWQDYLQASADMLHYTHKKFAPWHIIANDDKYLARIDVLKAIIKQLKQ